MELSAVGERVFAAESIIKRRIRRVRHNVPPSALHLMHHHCPLIKCFLSISVGMQGRMEYLVKWKGWSPK